MVSPFNLRGYVDSDPLDAAPAWFRLLLISVFTFGVSAAFLYLAIDVLRVATLQYSWSFWAECALAALALAPLVMLLRKASSLVPIALVALTLVPIDVILEAHLRMVGKLAPWTYLPTSVLGPLPPLLRILAVWLGDGVVMGPACLWLTRLCVAPLARAVKAIAPSFAYPAGEPDPTRAQRAALFPDDWTNERISAPRHDFSFYVLRTLGLAYLGYFLFALIGLLGVAPWPAPARDLLEMTYANSALTINTLIKISLMVNLAFIGAYNASLRYHTSLVLLIGHLASTAASVALYVVASPSAAYRSFLLTSAIVDAVLAVFLAWNMHAHRQLAQRFKKDPEFPEFFSLPQRLTKYFYRVFGVSCAGIVVGVIILRFACDGTSGWGAVYGYPDPQVCNTITKYSTLSALSFLISDREELREDLLGVLIYAYALSVASSTLWLLFGDWLSDTRVATRSGGLCNVDWYFALNIAMDGGLAFAFVLLRKLYYVIDYSVVALGPTSAHNVMSLHEALYPEVGADHGAIVRRIDRHVGDVRGRKRGILNAPFWLLEHVVGVIYGLRPAFSGLGPDERLYLLRTYVLRRPEERQRSFLPPLAELVYKAGTAIHAFVTLAHYSSLKGRDKTGYVPPGARVRLQTAHALGPPDGSAAAALPQGPNDAANYAAADPSPARALIAPRVATALAETALPDDVDYLIVGSGAGGAVMAYRLACTVNKPARILVVERGPRFSPLSDFSDDEMEMVRRLYKEGGLQQTKRFDLTILQGECVGGSTVINNACCVAMPATVRRVWAEDFGLELTGIDQEYERVAGEIEISAIDDSALNPRVAAAFNRAVAGYNTLADQPLTHVPVRTNHRAPLGTGLDNIGDHQIRKRSMLETYLPWAEARGVQIASETTAVSLLPSGNGKRADGVLLSTGLGQLHRVRVRKAVVLAGGVIASSHVLMRSGIAGNVGQHVACNFALPAALELPERVDAFDGLQITLGATDAQSRAIFETYFNPPGSFAISLPFYFSKHAELMSKYRNLVNFGALVGAEPNGTVERTPDWLSGRPVSWRLGQQDAAHIRFALTTLVGIAVGANASRIILPTEPGLDIPATKAGLARFQKALDGYPLRMADLRLVTAHPQGGNRMAAEGSRFGLTRAVDSTFRVKGWENVFVADASVFPAGITVNPQWTIMALSSLAAVQVASA